MLHRIDIALSASQNLFNALFVRTDFWFFGRDEDGAALGAFHLSSEQFDTHIQVPATNWAGSEKVCT
jgi:hypothetical protein